MSRKIKIGIDINEIFRARSYQIDKFFVQEFGEFEILEQSYVYDSFNNYPWKPIMEEIKELREPEDMPENINPIDYQVDENSGEAPADFVLFKQTEKKYLSAKEVYNRFMFEDFVFEIFGSAPLMYKNMDLDVKNFYLKYKDFAEFTLMSVENHFTKPHTLIFLSKMGSRFDNYRFVEKSTEMWNDVDILITTDPEILKKNIPWGKKLIKIKRPYNVNFKSGSIEALQINDLNGNKLFEKMIKYKNDKKNLIS